MTTDLQWLLTESFSGFRGSLWLTCARATVLGGQKATREAQGLGPEVLGPWLGSTSMSQLFSVVCSSPADSRFPSHVPVPRGNLIGSATNSFLCLDHSQTTELCVAWPLGSRCLPIIDRRGQSISLLDHLNKGGGQAVSKEEIWPCWT